MYIKTTDDLLSNPVALATRLVMYALDKTKVTQADSDYAKLLERYYEDEEFRSIVEAVSDGFGVKPMIHSGRERLVLRRFISRTNRKHPLFSARQISKDHEGIRAIILFGICVSFYQDRGGLIPLLRNDPEYSDENFARGEAIYEFINNFAIQQYDKQENKNVITPAKQIATMDSGSDKNGSRRTFGHHFEQVIGTCLEERWIEERTKGDTVYETVYAPTEQLMALLINVLSDNTFKEYVRDAAQLNSHTTDKGDKDHA